MDKLTAVHPLCLHTHGVSDHSLYINDKVYNNYTGITINKQININKLHYKYVNYKQTVP